MPLITPDLSQVGPIQPGTYAAKITACPVQTSKKGNQMIVPDFDVNVNGETRSRRAYLVTEGPGAYGFSQLLRACGFDDLANQYEDPNQPNPPFDTDELVGSELNLVIEEDMYEGSKTDRITAYMKA